MTAFNEANDLIHELLVKECVFPIDLDNIRIEKWLYQSEYPLSIPEQPKSNRHRFTIKLYQWESITQSLKLIELKYLTAKNGLFKYLNSDEIDASINQLGKSFIESVKFINYVKPLMTKGFREYAIKHLIDRE